MYCSNGKGRRREMRDKRRGEVRCKTRDRRRYMRDKIFRERDGGEIRRGIR